MKNLLNTYLGSILILTLFSLSSCLQSNPNETNYSSEIIDDSLNFIVETDTIKEWLKNISYYDPDTLILDFNEDDFNDTLIISNSYGSMAISKDIQLINGKSQESIELSHSGFFCEIIDFIALPRALDKADNESFKAVFYKILGGRLDKHESMEPSLEWLLEANIKKQSIRNKHFSHIYPILIKWHEGPPKLPKSYFIELEPSQLSDHYYWDKEYSPKCYTKGKSNGLLFYYAHNHYRHLESNPKKENHRQPKDSLLLAVKTEDLTIYKTSHGLIAEKDDKYAWIFITNYPTTGGPSKLRRPSIGDVAIVENYVIFKMKSSGEFFDPLYIININTGFCARTTIKENFSHWIDIKNDSIFVGNSFYNLKAILKEFERIQ